MTSSDPLVLIHHNCVMCLNLRSCVGIILRMTAQHEHGEANRPVQPYMKGLRLQFKTVRHLQHSVAGQCKCSAVVIIVISMASCRGQLGSMNCARATSGACVCQRLLRCHTCTELLLNSSPLSMRIPNWDAVHCDAGIVIDRSWSQSPSMIRSLTHMTKQGVPHTSQRSVFTMLIMLDFECHRC
jgi:hypothetical protein